MRPRCRRYFRTQSLAAALVLVTIALGCAQFSKQPPPQKADTQVAAAQPSATPSPAAPAGPVENIQISYAHPNDYLESLSVTKFWGARVILTRQRNGKTYSVVRFTGGDPIWQIRNEGGPNLLAHLPGAGKTRSDALKSVSYGQIPDNFVQESPDYGSPEPLEPNRYYVFAVARGSGALSFQAIKIQADGTIEVYDADPHAGTSYELCCDLPSDFVSPPEPEDEEPPP